MPPRLSPTSGTGCKFDLIHTLLAVPVLPQERAVFFAAKPFSS